MNYTELPDGYILLRGIDLQKDKRLALLVNGLSFGIAAIMVIAAHLFIPFSTFISFSENLYGTMLQLLLLLPAMLLYVVSHELIHGFYMKKFGGIKANYGFTGLYAYAGSKAYFNRRSYLLIALAPVILWGGVLMLLNFFVPTAWFWFVYIIQILNLSGAAGDFYVSVYMSRLPCTILIQDSGVRMDIYALAQKEE